MNARNYELVVSNLIKLLSKNDLIVPPGISHLKKFTGNTGEIYEIDLSYIFRVAEAEYLTLIECKCWNQSVGRDIVNAFSSVIDDIGAHKGIVVTTVGFQKGALGFAAKSGIGLFKITDNASSFEIVQRLEGPTQDIERFLTEDTKPFSGGDLKDLNGLVVAKTNIFDYVSVRYGEEVASFLEYDDVRSLGQIRESSFKENLKNQLMTMGRDWFFEYLKIESCGMPVIVEPQLFFRKINMKAYIAIMEIKKRKGHDS